MNESTDSTPTENAPADNSPSRRDRIALGWFVLGALVGAVATVGVFTFNGALRPSTTTGASTGAAAPAAGASDLAAIRDAARQGAQDALIAYSDRISGSIQLADIREAAKAGVAEALADQPAAAAGNDSDPSVPADVDPAATKNITTRASNTDGDAAAAVTIIEYSDFQCPFCKRFHDQVEQQIVDQYVKTGKVKLSYKHFPFLGDESKWAAQAAECAADQNRFWDYHDTLFARQAGENAGGFTKDKLIALATEIKLNTDTFTQCLNGDKTLERVTADANEGNTLGVRGTPSFLINGKLLVGAQPFEAFKNAIEAALAK
jgi:protein-disulfide isomerase